MDKVVVSSVHFTHVEPKIKYREVVTYLAVNGDYQELENCYEFFVFRKPKILPFMRKQRWVKVIKTDDFFYGWSCSVSKNRRKNFYPIKQQTK